MVGHMQQKLRCLVKWQDIAICYTENKMARKYGVEWFGASEMPTEFWKDDGLAAKECK